MAVAVGVGAAVDTEVGVGVPPAGEELGVGVLRRADGVGVALPTPDDAVAVGVATPCCPTVTATVARFESVEPSQAANVNESAPLKSASGEYPANVPFNPIVPWAGCETMRSVNAL